MFLAVYIWPHDSDKEGFRLFPGKMIFKIFCSDSKVTAKIVSFSFTNLK